jgi:hypothetical protein
MIVPILAALLDECDLVDALILEAAQMQAKLLRCADASGGAGLGKRSPHLFVGRPDIGLARLVLAKNIVMRQRIAEEFETILAAAFCFLCIRMH